MKLEHIALNVIDKSEIDDFYCEVLGMEVIRTFTLQKDTAQSIFSISREIPVYFLKNEILSLEIFINSEKLLQGFNHICISVFNRELLMKNAINLKYKVIQIPRENSDLIFISDKSGNMFEIKQNSTKNHQ